MVRRKHWIQSVEEAWGRRSVLWLAGVRRVGKTSLCQTLDDIEYFDCELPRTRRLMEEDPEAFLAEMRGRRIVLDEIHRLGNPSQLLKIAADHFPDTPVLATGSSTFEATAKFRDTLTGRRETVWMTPMIDADLGDFGGSFQRFLELLFAQSGGMFEATRFAGPCEVSRQTISNYLAALETTFAAHVVRPFSTRRANEIVAAPKVYGFDTGFVSFYRGWQSLREEDLDPLWEHFVLNEIQGRLQTRALRYWRNKQGAEVDFVLPRHGDRGVVAIECKWRAAAYDAGPIAAFRHLYPEGSTYVVATDVDRAQRRRYDDFELEVVSLKQLIERLAAEPTIAL